MLSLYLLHSFKRRPLRHISLAWILMCAFLLPLVVSVYRDSLTYGIQLQNQDKSKESAFHISGAAPEDVAYFQNIEGLTDPIYEDGTIYLSFASDEAWKRFTDWDNLEHMSSEDLQAFWDEQNRIEQVLYMAIGKSSHSLRLTMYAYDEWHGINNDPVMESHLQKIRRLNIALLLFSGLIVCSAYTNHIAGFSQEVADLRALGATKRQIVRLFLAEFGILFPLAAASAIGVSWVVMGYLYEHFLGNTADSVAVWEVFYMSPRNTALEILFYFLVCLCSMAVSLQIRPRQKKIQKTRFPSASLPAKWIHRTKPPYVRCLVVLVPLMTAFVLLFNQYLSIYAQNVYAAQDAKIVITHSEWGFSQEVIDTVSGFTGVERVEQQKTSNPMFFLFTPQGDTLTAAVHTSQDSSLRNNTIAAELPGGTAEEGTYYLAEVFHPEDRIEVTVASVSESQSRYEVNVYVSDELMQQLMSYVPVAQLVLYTNAQTANSLEKNLTEYLSSDYVVTNFQNGTDTSTARQEGRLLLLSWIFCILMLVAIQIIWVRLTRYVNECAPMLRVIHQVGGSRRQLANLIPAWIGAIPAIVLPFVIAIPWAKIEASQTNRPFIISIPVLGIYLGIGLLAALSFWGPIKYSLWTVLKAEHS